MLMSKKKEISRRTFLTEVAAGGAACAIVPRHVLGHGFVPPSDTLNIAAVGVGGMGRANLINLASQNIVALCDVDWDYAGKSFEHLDSDMAKLRERMEKPETRKGISRERAESDLRKLREQLDGMARLQTEHVPKAKRY